MRTIIKAMIGFIAAVVLLAAVGSGGGPKDCNRYTCNAQERIAWRDALEAKEREKAHGLGMTWHSFQMKAGSGINEFAGDLRDAARR